MDTISYLKSKANNDRQYLVSLEISGNCKDNCLDKLIQNKNICDNCIKIIEKRMINDLKGYSEGDKLILDKLRIPSQFKHLFNSGKTLILNVPPKSFRNLKKKNKLKAYQEIIKFKMKDKGINKIHLDKEIKLYLKFHIKDYYSKIDCDNMAKSICDSLENILYCNDSQIKTLIVEKEKVNSKREEAILISINPY